MLRNYSLFVSCIIVCSLLLSCGGGGNGVEPDPPTPPQPKVPGKVTLSVPTNSAMTQDTSLAFSWQSVPGATAYQIQVATNTSFTSPVVDVQDITTTQHTATLQSGTTYHWRVRASNSVGNGDWSNVWMFGTKLAKVTLSVPKDTATNQNTALTLSWQSVRGAMTYQIQVDTTDSFTSPVVDVQDITTTQHTATLQVGTSYHWRVRASNSGGSNGEWSEVRTFTTLIPSVAPEEQVMLSAPSDNAMNQDTMLTLSWQLVSQATAYRIQVATNNSFTPTVVDVPNLTKMEYEATLRSGTTYYWRVQALNNIGPGPWSEVRMFETASPPEKVTLSVPSDSATNQNATLTLSWQPISGATAYQIQVSTSSTDFSSPVVDVDDLTTPQYQAALESGTRYYWRVRALNSVGGGEWSDVQTFATRLAKVALSAPSNNAINQDMMLTLEWQSVSGATAYQIQVSTSSTDFSSPVVDVEGLTTTQHIPTLQPSTTYHWRVRASNSDGNGEWSDVRTFTTQAPQPPSIVMLSMPSDTASNQDTILTFSWQLVSRTTEYQIQVSTSSTDFSSSVVDQRVTTTQHKDTLRSKITYYWRVRASNEAGNGAWSEVWTFATGKTYRGGIRITTQAQIDNFSSYTRVTGAVDIGARDANRFAITNLDGLSGLISVEGYLDIEYLSDLTSLEGLNNLSYVKEWLGISNMPKLTSLSALDGLTHVGGDGIYILENITLPSLEGLNNLTNWGKNLFLQRNFALTSLSALNNITSLKGNLDIRDSHKLPSLEGLNNLTSVGTFLWIHDNDSLKSLEGLNALESVGGHLTIDRNDALPSLEGLNNVTSVGTDLRIWTNGKLTNLCAVRHLLGTSTGKVGTGEYRVSGNAYNPSYTAIQNTGSGGCEQ